MEISEQDFEKLKNTAMRLGQLELLKSFTVYMLANPQAKPIEVYKYLNENIIKS